MDKQIEEMSNIITKTCENKRVISSYRIAEKLYAKGYRKQSDVVREIFEEIESKLILNKAIHCGQKIYYTRIADDISELKKKYTQAEGEKEDA